MIITKTPFRMSFFGGGTDIEEYFKENGGAVISTTFDKYCYVIIRHLPHFFDYSSEFIYSKIERVCNCNDIEHPLIRNAIKMQDIQNIRLSYEADLPARSGLGTSSSFAVGMLNAFHKIKNNKCTKETLAKEAIYLERVLCNEAGGWQDQIAAAYGGLNKIEFNGNGFAVNPIKISDKRKKELNSNLMLFFTGFTRLSSEIQKKNILFDIEKKKKLKEIHSMVYKAEEILTDDKIPLREFGNLLDYEWALKKQSSNGISTDIIDKIYSDGKKAGAIGGKLLGAGGGGFFIFYVEPENKIKVKTALKNLLYVPFGFVNEGSQIVHFSPDNYNNSINGDCQI